MITPSTSPFISTLLYMFSRFFGRKQFYSFGLVLQHLAHRMMGIGNYETFEISGEKYLLQKLVDKVSAKPIIFDVGSHKGSYINQVLNTFPLAQVHSFEPIAPSYTALTEAFSKKKNIILNNVAVGAKNASIAIWDKNDNNGSSHASIFSNVIEKDLKITDAKKYKVKLIYLDEYIRHHNIKRIDLLKIDVEGAEFEVLSGLKQNLKKISVIQFEFNSMNSFSGTFFWDFYKLLKNDYSLYRLYQNGLHPIKKYNQSEHEIFEFQNVVAINKKFKI